MRLLVQESEGAIVASKSGAVAVSIEGADPSELLLVLCHPEAPDELQDGLAPLAVALLGHKDRGHDEDHHWNGQRGMRKGGGEGAVSSAAGVETEPARRLDEGTLIRWIDGRERAGRSSMVPRTCDHRGSVADLWNIAPGECCQTHRSAGMQFVFQRQRRASGSGTQHDLGASVGGLSTLMRRWACWRVWLVTASTRSHRRTVVEKDCDRCNEEKQRLQSAVAQGYFPSRTDGTEWPAERSVGNGERRHQCLHCGAELCAREGSGKGEEQKAFDDQCCGRACARASYIGSAGGRACGVSGVRRCHLSPGRARRG